MSPKLRRLPFHFNPLYGVTVFICLTLSALLCASMSFAQERRFTHDDFIKAFPKPAASRLEEAERLYAERCVNCHGAKGNGDGVLSRKMSPRPRNLRSRAWFESLEYPERIKRLKRSIIGGGPAVGGSALMPPNPDLRNKPELLYALVYYLALPHKPSPIPESEAQDSPQGATP